MKSVSTIIWLITMGTMIFTLLCCAKCDESDYAVTHCQSDRDCPETMFCRMKPSICVFCMNCTLYNRHKGILRCVRDIKHCGSCLPGYSYKENDLDTSRLMCLKNLDIGPPIAQKMDGTVVITLNSTWLMVGTLCVIIIMIVSTYFCYKQQVSVNYSSSRTSSLSHVITPPPPYENCVTTIDIENSNTTCIDAFNFSIHENARNDKQKAVPFMAPSYITQNCNGNSEHEYSSSSSEDDHVTDDNEIVRSTVNSNTHTNTTVPNIRTPEQSDSQVINESSASELSPLSNEDVECIVNSEPEISPPEKRRRIDEDNNECDSGNGEIQLNFTINQEFTITKEDN